MSFSKAFLDLDENSSDSEADVDYVPPETALSEVSDDGELISSDDENTKGKKLKRKRKREVRKNIDSEKDLVEETDAKDKQQETQPEPVDEKQKANDLWKSFLEDVSGASVSGNSVSHPTSSISSTSEIDGSISVASPSSSANASEKQNECEIYEFAGEKVSVSEDGCIKSTSLKSNLFGITERREPEEELTHAQEVHAPISGSVKRKGGLGSVLNSIINKKQKLTTLQKSLVDWKSFKKDEGIDEELKLYNKGKHGFMERKRFLERSDIRSFEIERDARLSKVKKS